MTTLTERLARCYTGAVHDVLRMMGHDNIVLPPGIKAIAPGTRLAGPGLDGVRSHRPHEDARTRRCSAGARCCRRRRPGHVVVCQPNNHEVALMGELSAQTLAARGVLGYVVDGGSRDTDLVLAQGFPVFCSFLTPSDIVERWIPDRYGEPVTIGTVTIATGDYLLGDRDGVVDHSARARRGRRREDRGGRRDRERHAPRARRRHGSGRRVQQVWKVLTGPRACGDEALAARQCGGRIAPPQGRRDGRAGRHRDHDQPRRRGRATSSRRVR